MPPQSPLDIIKTTGPQISNLKEEISRARENLGASPTGGSSLTVPTPQDIGLQTKISSLETQKRALEKKNLSAAWYGNEAGGQIGDRGGDPGIIGKTLDVLQRPLQTVVKGVKGLIGDKTDVPGQEFTDLLRQHGVTGPGGAALGFTLDVALDPVNWITAGTAALIPRVGAGLFKGAAKGGIEGAAKAGMAGLSSSLQQKAAFAARWTPGLGGSKGSFVKTLSDKAYLSYQNYQHLADIDPMKYIKSPGIARGMKTGGLGRLGPESDYGLTLGDFYKGVLSYIPHGDDFYRATYYDSKNWLDLKRMQDVIDKRKSPTSAEARAPSALGEALSEGESLSSVKPNFDLIKNVPPGQEKNILIDELNKTAEDVSFMGKNPGQLLSANPEQNTIRVLQEAAHADAFRIHLEPLVAEFGSGGPTGIKWWDDSVEWGNKMKVKLNGKEVAPIKAFLDTYNSIIQGVYKPAHTILSPVTWAMNILSAVPMYMMVGGENVAGFVNGYRRAFLGLSGINPKFYLVDDFLGMAKNSDESWKNLRSEDFRKAMEGGPDVMRRTMGVGPGYFYGIKYKDVVDKAVAEGIYTADEVAANVADKELISGLKEFQEEIRRGNISGKPTKRLFGFLQKLTHSPAPTQVDVLKNLRARVIERRGGKPPAGIEKDLPGGTQFGEEVSGYVNMDTAAQTELLERMTKFVKAKADSGNRAFQVFDNLMRSAENGYSRLDQSFRISVLRQLMNHGVSEDGIKIMSRTVPITNPETQIISDYVLNGKKMYRLSYDYATEVAQEAAINYGAMPAAIRMLRSMPLVGAPFASFTYGMGIKTAQSLAYNPAFFNKVSYGIQSASGHKTPLEKKSLESQYYDWYSQPSMMRLPDAANFFSKYPLYWNLASALPYYSLNIFQPASRSYSSVLPNTIVQILDRAPALKDPLGQTLFDNFVLPMILSSAERPMSAIGAPLYPIGATAGDKAFYAGRGLVDAMTPAVVSPAGLFLPSEYAKYYPGYKTRQMSYGTDERNQQGVPGTEDKASRAIRNILSYLGLPLNIANTKYAESQAKKAAE